MPLHTRYLVTETGVGVVVTIALSCGFAWLVFGRALPIDAADPMLQVDAGLQAFIVAFMGSLVPTAVTRRRTRSGHIAAVQRPHGWPTGLVARSGVLAALVALPAAAVHAAVMTRLPGLELGLGTLLLYKACFGVAVALVATPAAVALALRDR